MKLVLLGSYHSYILRKNVVLYVSLMFVRVLVCFHLFVPKNGLMWNFLLESDKRVKPVLLPLYSCLVAMIIFMDLFGYVCMPFLIYLVSSS